MPTFVHITTEDAARKVRRGGIRVSGSKGRTARGVFAMPVTPNFQVTHQWVRELKKWKRGTMVGVYFRITDTELVWLGRYNAVPKQLTAAQACAHIMSQTTMTGVQVHIPRRIEQKEILYIRPLPQTVGWRHYPEAHGQRPWACACCQKGEFRSRKIREKFADPSA